MCMRACVSVCVCFGLCVSVCVCLCLSVSLSVRSSVCLSVGLTVSIDLGCTRCRLSVRLLAGTSVRPSIMNTLQIILWHREEESQNANSHVPDN